jgi:hypothetical protein
MRQQILEALEWARVGGDDIDIFKRSQELADDLSRFRVTFQMVVRKGSPGDVWLARVLKLPFMPTIGMEFHEGPWDATVQEMYWHDGELFAMCGECIATALRSDEEMQRATEAYVADGWYVCKGYLDSERAT